MRYKEVNSSKVEHIPVLAGTLIEQINLPRDGVMVDATIGHGGHSFLFGQTLGPEAVLIGLDLDKKAIRGAQFKLKDLSCKVILLYANFSEICEQVRGQGIERVDFILADLGVSSVQLADAKIGLSFQTDMPLGFIVRERQSRPITTTGQLASIVCRALGQPGRRRKSRIHPATRTFQALRIAVNNELENLEKLLSSASGMLAKKGRIAVISYHSLEDRLVKNNFKANEKDGIYKIITKKPIVPSREEIALNQRARSAKLRIAERQ